MRSIVWLFILLMTGSMGQAQSVELPENIPAPTLRPFFFEKDSFRWDKKPRFNDDRLAEVMHNFKVFWWNIDCGMINSQIVNRMKRPESLNHNISALINSDLAPDVMVLGEHCPSSLEDQTRKRLAKIYKHSFRLKKSNPLYRIHNGFLVLSRTPLQVIANDSITVDNDKYPKPSKKDDWARPYILLKTTFKDKDYFINPVHLNQPWGSYISQILGTDNPNYAQAKTLVENLLEDVDIDNERLISIGDYNSAKSILLASMASYKLFDRRLNEVIQRDVVTFPSDSALDLGASNIRKAMIDHAFVSPAMETYSGLVMPLRGSGHYPLYIFVR